jgi:hypothetical protein
MLARPVGSRISGRLVITIPCIVVTLLHMGGLVVGLSCKTSGDDDRKYFLIREKIVI